MGEKTEFNTKKLFQMKKEKNKHPNNFYFTKKLL